MCRSRNTILQARCQKCGRDSDNIAILERPAPDGPYGGKGPGEMCANPVLPAVANAVFNAVGVRVDDLPITPEKVLRAIKAQGGARPQARR